MPYLLIRTNQPLEQAQQGGITATCSAAVAKMLGKPEQYVMVSIESGVTMRFVGSDAPCAYLELKSIGLPGGQTARYSETLCRVITEALGVSPERIYIEFANAEPRMWGWDSGTF